MDCHRPLVRSQGSLDPIGDLLISRKLDDTSDDHSILAEESRDYQRVNDQMSKQPVSHDTPDLGMTLWSSHWLAYQESYSTNLQRQAAEQSRILYERGYGNETLSGRLAFREYGTCLGIGCVEKLDGKLQQFRDRGLHTRERHRDNTPGD